MNECVGITIKNIKTEYIYSTDKYNRSHVVSVYLIGFDIHLLLQLICRYKANHATVPAGWSAYFRLFIYFNIYTRRRQRTARLPSVARGTIFDGTLSELKYSDYDLIKNIIFNSIEAFDNFIIKFQNNVFRT
jgi:hypothetical protein